MNVWMGGDRVASPAVVTWRRVILAAASVGVLAGCGISGATAADQAPRARPPADASRAAATWPACAAKRARIAARAIGAGLGHVGVLFTVHNTAAQGCRLAGYAGLRLLGPGARPLPTTVHHSASGTYLFPPIAKHPVALKPGGYAAFMLEYEDNPWGALASEPYAKACPAATGAKVTLPGARAASAINVVSAAMAPCGGDVWISPVFPGRTWINSP
jgi:hypothetical protein